MPKKQLTKGQQKRKLEAQLSRLLRNDHADCFCRECADIKSQISKIRKQLSDLSNA